VCRQQLYSAHLHLLSYKTATPKLNARIFTFKINNFIRSIEKVSFCTKASSVVLQQNTQSGSHIFFCVYHSNKIPGLDSQEKRKRLPVCDFQYRVPHSVPLLQFRLRSQCSPASPNICFTVNVEWKEVFFVISPSSVFSGFCL